MHIRARILGVAASVCLLCLALPAQAAPSTKATLAGSVPSWAKAANFKGAAAGTDSIGFRVYLGWSNPSAVEALAKAVSDPKSASYKQFLTSQQFRQQFSPSQAQVGAVQSWLRGQGFSVNYTPSNNHYVSAEGTVAQASAAFGTTFGMYAYKGLTLRSPSSAASVPSNLASIVSGVVGLDDSAQLVFSNRANDPKAPPAAAFVSAQPCSSYWGQKTTTDLITAGVAITDPTPLTLPLKLAPCGYVPSQILGAYGLAGSGLTGAGQTVAIIDAYASPTIQADLNTWSGLHSPGGVSTNITQVVAPGTYNHPERGQKQDPQGWYGEETLDVESVHGMAPGAHIVYVGAPNNFQDLDAALNHVVDRHLASIVTNSYGFPTEALPPGFIRPYEDTILQGVVTGIGIYFSSGDNSDESLSVGYRTADWPASSPFVTAVGGTSIGIDQGNNRAVETGWGTHSESLQTNGSWVDTGWLYGSGGGVSRLFAEPSYQQGVVPQSVFTVQGHSGRALPDIAAIGDPNTGYLVGQTQTFPDGTVKYSEYRLGGTSLSSPIMAGIMALAQEAKGGPFGFANPLFYSKSGAFYDVLGASSLDPHDQAVVRTNYNNGVDASGGLSYRLRTFDQGLSLQTTSGYDDVTGLGTPGGSFIFDLTH